MFLFIFIFPSGLTGSMMGPYDFDQRYSLVAVVLLFNQLSSWIILHKLTCQPQLLRAHKLVHEVDHAHPYEAAKYGTHHAHVVIQLVRLSSRQLA